MRLHICIRNNDGTHYQIYGDIADISVFNTTGDDSTTYETLDIRVYNRNDIRIMKETPEHTEICTAEFISAFAHWSGTTLHIDWRAAGSKLSINGFGQV